MKEKDFDGKKFFNSAITDQAIQDLESNLENFKKMTVMRARMNKILFDSLVQEGFSKPEALELLKHRGF